MAVYVLSMLGGFVADRFIGAAAAVVIGALVIALGHFCLALGSETSLYVGLSCVALGTSFLKPNVTTLVGRLYAPGDTRRDAGFSLYYMGINVGACVAPLVCGYLAQGAAFREGLRSLGIDPRHSWHFGFGAAGIGMLIGLAVFARGWSRWRALEVARLEIDRPASAAPMSEYAERFAAIAFFCVGAVVFFATAKQAGSSLNLFADRMTRTEVFGWSFPSSWFQSASALFVVMLAPLFSLLWLKLGTRQPSGAAKVVLGLASASLAFTLMSCAAVGVAHGLVSPLWLLSVYFFQTVGEMCVSPVGLSHVARLAPVRFVGLMMGLWFVAIGLGAKLAGVLAAGMDGSSPGQLTWSFGRQALVVAAAAAILALVVPRIRRIVANQDGRASSFN